MGSVIHAPDLDAALEWGRKLAQAVTLRTEVRPLQEGKLRLNSALISQSWTGLAASRV